MDAVIAHWRAAHRLSATSVSMPDYTRECNKAIRRFDASGRSYRDRMKSARGLSVRHFNQSAHKPLVRKTSRYASGGTTLIMEWFV